MAGRKKTGSKNSENVRRSGGGSAQKGRVADDDLSDVDEEIADETGAVDFKGSAGESIDDESDESEFESAGDADESETASNDDYDSDDDSAYETDFSFGSGDRSEGGLKGAVGEGLKKLFAAGVSAAFMTEESVRSYLGDVKLPKEVLKLFVEGATKSKEQLMNRVGNEVITIIQKIDFVKEASRFVETHKFRISAEVEVLKKDPSSSEQGRASFSVNMDRKSRGESSGADE